MWRDRCSRGRGPRSEFRSVRCSREPAEPGPEIRVSGYNYEPPNTGFRGPSATSIPESLRISADPCHQWLKIWACQSSAQNWVYTGQGGFSVHLSPSPEWRNWQTRGTQNPVPSKGVWVRDPLRAPFRRQPYRAMPLAVDCSCLLSGGRIGQLPVPRLSLMDLPGLPRF